MTHTPPIPTANKAPYPLTDAANQMTTDKAELVARMKTNSSKQQTQSSTLPLSLIAGALLIGGIGYALWTGGAKANDRK